MHCAQLEAFVRSMAAQKNWPLCQNNATSWMPHNPHILRDITHDKNNSLKMCYTWLVMFNMDQCLLHSLLFNDLYYWELLFSSLLSVFRLIFDSLASHLVFSVYLILTNPFGIVSSKATKLLLLVYLMTKMKIKWHIKPYILKFLWQKHHVCLFCDWLTRLLVPPSYLYSSSVFPDGFLIE